MPSVVVCIPELQILGKSVERKREIYVIGLATDNRGKDPKRGEAPIAAYNETLANVAPEVQKAAVLQYALISVSNIFPRIRKDQKISLSGSGILIYPNLDPMGMLATHFVVVESDAGTRNLGNMLDGILNDESVKSVVKLLAAGITQPLLAALMTGLIGQIPSVLKKNRDDLLFAHNHSGFDFDDYGLRPGEIQSDYSVGNDRAHCVLRVRVNKTA